MVKIGNYSISTGGVKPPEPMKYLERCSQKDYTLASIIFTYGPVQACKGKNEKELNSLISLRQKHSLTPPTSTSKKILKLALVTLGIIASFYFMPAIFAIATTALLLSSLLKITIHEKKYRSTFFKTPFVFSPILRFKGISAYLFGTKPPVLNNRFVIRKTTYGFNL